MAGRTENDTANNKSDKIKRGDTTPNISRTISMAEYEVMIKQQCPLPPRKFMYRPHINENKWTKPTTAWFYENSFWIKCEEEDNKIYEVIFRNTKDFKKYRKRVYAMRTADEYIDCFKLQKSESIYKMLTSAVGEDINAMSKSDKKEITRSPDSNLDDAPTNAAVYASKFKPKWWDRFVFLGVFGRVLLNAFYIIYNFVTINEVPTEYRIFVGIVVGIEAVLFIISASRCGYNLWSLMTRVCQGDTTHFQCKNVPVHLRQLGSLSVMRYLPSGESVKMFKKRGKEWLNERKANYKFEMKNSHKFKCCVRLRWLILAILDVIGPLVAIFSLLFKMAQLDFQWEVFQNWEWIEILTYFAFVNQVAGIRKVRYIEIDSLQHFIFSGSDIKMDATENLLLEWWWNYTMVSVLANICSEFKYPVFDSIIFWYNLNVRRIQLLFKDHGGHEGRHFFDLKSKSNGTQWKVDFKKYDTKIKVLSQTNLHLNLSETEDDHTDNKDAFKAPVVSPAVVLNNTSEEEEVLMTETMEEELKVQSADDSTDNKQNVEEETKDNDENGNDADVGTVVDPE